jgi:hypothetical protein
VRWPRLPGPAVVVIVAMGLARCGETRSPLAPPSPSPTSPVLIEQSGPVEILFLESTPAPGSTIAGCGASIRGCQNRVAMRVSLRGEAGGPVLFSRAFLHATNQRACLQAATGPFELQPGQVRELVVVFDRSEDCGVPLEIATLAVVVEGPVQVSSRRAWAVSYRFEP